MKSDMLIAGAALFLASAHIGAAHAQSAYPTKAIRLIVPFAPGGPNDILGRLMAQKLHEEWGQPVVVENRGGAGGTVGLGYAAKQPGDGYTLAMGGSSNMAVAVSTYKKLAYDPLRDFVAIASVAHVPYGLGVNPVVPVKSVQELIAIARKKPRYLSYASSGAGSMSSLSAELFKALSRTDILHVPYKGTAPALTEVVAGQVDMMFADLALIRRYAEAKRLKIIAVTGSKRAPAAPEVPTISEAGLKGYVIEPWFGVVAPAGVPPEIVSRLSASIVASLKSPDVVQRLDHLGYEPIGAGAGPFAETIRKDIEKFAKIAKTAGLAARF